MPHEIARTLTTRWDAGSVLTYMLDFTSAEEWDAGTVSCTLLSGDGGVGTRYRNVSKFLGRETTLDYEVESVSPGRQFVITGRNKTVTSRDTITVRAAGTGTEVEYRAQMTFHGFAAMVSPLLSPFLKKLGDDTETKLTRILDARADHGR